MTDTRIAKLAEIMVDYSLEIKKGDNFIINSNALATPLIKEVYRLAIRKGAMVDVYSSIPALKTIYYKEAQKEQISNPTILEKTLLSKYNKVLHIIAENNTKAHSNVPGETMKNCLLGRKDIRKAFFDREEKGEVQWCSDSFSNYSNGSGSKDVA